jgi:hypothetical protein
MMVFRKDLAPVLAGLNKDRQKSRNEVFWCYHRKQKELMWGSKDELTEQIKIWKKQRKSGELTLLKKNVKTVKVQGKTYYTFTLTPTINGEAIDCGIDPIGACGLDESSFMVRGYMYFFVAKFNRDTCFNWIMDSNETF